MIRTTASYVRTWSNPSAAGVQKKLILEYCKDHGITCSNCYEDNYSGKKYKHAEYDAEEAGLFYDPNFPAWSKLLSRVCADEIDTIIVDTPLRLFRNENVKEIFLNACKDHGTSIVEAGVHETGDNASSVVIYHFTDASDARPSVALSAIDHMYSIAFRRKGWEISGLLLDLSLTKSRQINLERVLNGDVHPDIVYVKSFYHINKHMVSFWKAVRQLNSDGVKIVSEEEGELDLACGEFLKRNWRVAIYDQSRTKAEEFSRKIRMERLNVFVKCRTSWTVSEMFLDEFQDHKCPQKENLIRKKGTYDIVLMDSFSMIHPLTNNFRKFKNKIGVPIFSLREGGVTWIE